MQPLLHTSKSKAVRKSYSIPEDIVELFERESERRDVHPSTLLSQLLKKWLMFDLPLQKIGAVTVPEPCFQAIINNIPTDTLEEIAAEQAGRNSGMILSLLGRQDDGSLESVVQAYYQTFEKYSGWYSFRHDIIDHDMRRLSLLHTRGMKWSRYLASYNHVILERLCGKIDCRIDDKLVTFDVTPRQRLTI